MLPRNTAGVYAPCLRHSERYRRLDFEDDLAYDYDSYELDAGAAVAGLDAFDNDEEEEEVFAQREAEADEILRKAAGSSVNRGSSSSDLQSNLLDSA
jgi:hypothetical protein